MTALPTTPEAMATLMRERSVDASPSTAHLGIELTRCWDGEAELLIQVRPWGRVDRS